MNDPSLIADLIRAGVGADLVARVAAALANVRDSPGHVRDIVRAYESGRKRKHRENLAKSGGKQTMSAAISASEKNENVRDIASEHCESSSFLSSSTEVQRSKRETSSRRGTRMQPGQTINEADWQFARDRGHHDTAIAAIWAEFVDYWVAIPGQRGTKLDWSATWRNRVRQLSTGKKLNGKGTGSLAATADDLIARAEEIEGNQNTLGGSDDGFGRS